MSLVKTPPSVKYSNVFKMLSLKRASDECLNVFKMCQKISSKNFIQKKKTSSMRDIHQNISEYSNDF